MNQPSLSPEMEKMRQLIKIKRNTFQITLSELLIELDEFGIALSRAIGDISYNEALQGLANFLQEKVNERKLR